MQKYLPVLNRFRFAYNAIFFLIVSLTDYSESAYYYNYVQKGNLMVNPQLLSDQRQATRWWQVLGPSFPYRQFVIGAVVSITIFYIFQNFGQPLTGALFAAGWGICLLIITYWRFSRIEIFPALAVPIVLIELIGTLCEGE